MLYPFYKPLGQSTHQLAANVGRLFSEKATHTGTLDPMAEGVVIVLTGEDRLNKSSYTGWHKGYEFSILIGVSTDSHDLLGLTLEQVDASASLDEEKIKKNLQSLLPQYLGPQLQLIPAFSAKRIHGHSYFDEAKQAKTTPEAKQEIEVFDLQLRDVSSISIPELETQIRQKVSLVDGEFRQTEVLQNWSKTLANFRSNNQESLFLAHLFAQTSKRTYIRGLVRDIGASLQLPLTTFSITRTANGPYTIQDCLCLI